MHGKLSNKTAKLYRMVMDRHVCPYGLKSKYLLERKGYQVEDHWLTTRDETDAFKAKHNVETTPQTYIGGRWIGGYDALRRHFGLIDEDSDGASYKPVIAVFATALGIAASVSFVALGTPLTGRAAEWFVSVSMMLLAMLKLQDVERFSTMFLNYDLLARRWVPYSYIYPFGEFVAGLLMTAHWLPWLSIPLAAFIGTIGAVSVFHAVYVQKRELKCACVGGSSNVPLGFVSLTENLFMVGMAIWMLTAYL
ncbi:MAG: glutaredoxin [Novosphingobium sp.]|nr:glutaredoxin [Novosphingobium sp.]